MAIYMHWVRSFSLYGKKDFDHSHHGWVVYVRIVSFNQFTMTSLSSLIKKSWFFPGHSSKFGFSHQKTWSFSWRFFDSRSQICFSFTRKKSRFFYSRWQTSHCSLIKWHNSHSAQHNLWCSGQNLFFPNRENDLT